jgi:hypothetical protein
MTDGAGPVLPHKDAMSLMQELLNVQSRALLAGDVAAMRATVAMPYRRITTGMDLIIESETDFHTGIKAFASSLESLGVNHFIRLAADAEFLSDDRIEGYYVTHALRNATAMLPSYHNRIVLQNFDGAWRLVEVASDLVAKHWPINMLRVAEAGTMGGPARPIHDARRNAAEPLALYQRFIDRLTAATLNNNFDAYLALCDLPYSDHNSTIDTLLNTPEDVRPVFDMAVELIRGQAADTCVRRADSAQFLGSDIMCGYHETVFLKGGQPALPPIKSRMILKRKGVGWKLKHVTNAVANPSAPYSAPEPTEALPTHREIQERTKSWPTLH